jgi:hypothetical protein
MHYSFLLSTPSMFLNALQKETNLSFPVVTHDMLPLSMVQPGHIWSGYYTSRPNFKKLVRTMSTHQFLSFLQYSAHLLGFDNQFKPVFTYAMNNLQEETAAMMHHDTITGTSRAYVINNYAFQIERVLNANSKMISIVI